MQKKRRYRCGVVLGADNIWLSTIHWNGSAWVNNDKTFKSIDRVSDTQFTALDSAGYYWSYDNGTFTQLDITQPDVDSLKLNNWSTVYTGRDHNGDWYAMIQGRAHRSSDSFGGEARMGNDVLKWDGEKWVYQIMTDFNDPNDNNATEANVRIRPDGVNALTVPAENITIMYGEYGAMYIYAGNATITFVTNGGSAVAPLTAPMYSAITAPASPTREGYTFVGWYTLNDFMQNGPSFSFGKMPAGNITLYAKWVEKGAGEDPFVNERASAKESLESAYGRLDEGDYTTEVWSQITAAYEEGLENIDSADTYDGIYAALNTALDVIGTLAANTSSEITVAFTVEELTWNGELILEPTLVTVPKNARVSDTLEQLLDELYAGDADAPVPPYDIDTGNGWYIAGIWNGEQMLSEFDGGDQSGSPSTRRPR